MFNEDKIRWLIQNPDLLVAFLRKEAKVAKAVYGKRTPARRCWKRARKSALRLLNAIDNMDDYNDYREVNDGFDDAPQWRINETEYEIEKAKIEVIASLQEAIEMDSDEAKNLPWVTRTSLLLSRRALLTRLFMLNDPSPWETARDRARGIFF
ncbi:MAG: hypothetical protein LAT68_16305 [Cyclobacteriaceae bacterium]|nr:hypothetical protein [Cyclobacteriaceae bacterium]